MAQHTYDVKIDGQTYVVASETELSDGQAYQAAMAQHSSVQPVDADEPTTYGAGFWKGAKEGTIGGLKGFAKGFLPGAVEAIAGLPKAVLQAGIGTVKGAANLVTDPVQTLTDAYEAVKGIPGQGGDEITAALDVARKDPEAFGNMVGHLTGGVEAGIGMSGLVPLAPKPIAGAVGRTMEQVGTKGAWPIRMMGAHQLGSGNPMGVLTMMTPEALKSGGAALNKFATGVDVPQGAPRLRAADGEPTLTAGATGKTRIVPPQTSDIEAARTTVEKGLSKALDKAGNPAKAGLSDLDANIAENKRTAGAIRDRSARQQEGATKAEQRADAEQYRTENAARENAVRLDRVQAAKEGLVPGTPSVSESVSAKLPGGGSTSVRTPFKAPVEDVDPMDAALRKMGVPADKIKGAIRVAPKSTADRVAPQLGPVVDDTYRNNPNRLVARPIQPTEVDPVAADVPTPIESPMSAPARQKLDLSQRDRDLLDDIVTKAQEDGYTGNVRDLQEHLYDVVNRDMEAFGGDDAVNASPRRLLDAIKKRGGFSISKETALKGEMRHLKTYDKSLFSDATGVPADSMLEHLGQFPEFRDIKTINNLFDKVRGAATSPAPVSPVQNLKDLYGTDWWKRIGTPDEVSFDPQALETSGDTTTPGASPYQRRVVHITTPEGATGIRDQGFDMTRNSGTSGLGGDHYGPGVYAADEARDMGSFWRQQLATKNATGEVPTTSMPGKAALNKPFYYEYNHYSQGGTVIGQISPRQALATQRPDLLPAFDEAVTARVSPRQALGKTLRDAGYDGLIVEHRAGDEVIAFHPSGIVFDPPIETSPVQQPLSSSVEGANAAARTEAAQQPPAFTDRTAVASGKALEQSLRTNASTTPITEPTTIEGTLLRRALTPEEITTLPKSRSRTNASTGGMTANDIAAMKKFVLENPNADEAAITQHLLDQRAARSSAYRTNAGLNKGAQSAFDREKPE